MFLIQLDQGTMDWADQFVDIGAYCPTLQTLSQVISAMGQIDAYIKRHCSPPNPNPRLRLSRLSLGISSLLIENAIEVK